MGRKPAVAGWLLAASVLALGLLAGCGDTQTPVRNEPYQPSQPPADWLKEREAARANATPPPTGN